MKSCQPYQRMISFTLTIARFENQFNWIDKYLSNQSVIIAIAIKINYCACAIINYDQIFIIFLQTIGKYKLI